MSHFEIFGIYLVLNLILFLCLTFYIIRFRFGNSISVGDGGSTVLLHRIRAQGNYIENAPLHLIGLISMMQLGTSSLMMHVVGAMFIIGRILHAIGITRTDATNKMRQGGVVLTLLSFMILIVYLSLLLVKSFGSYGVS